MDVLLIPLLAISIPIIVVPVAVGAKYATRRRELEHAERIRAIELGRVLPQDEGWWTPARIAVSIGAGVPIGSLLSALMAIESAGYHEEIWMGAVMVSIASVIGGSVLAGQHFAHRAKAENLASSDLGKPAFDADAFDVVGRRG